LLLVLILIGAAGIAVAVVLGAVVARTALAPITRFTRSTEKLTGNPDLSQRLEVEGKDELARLASSFNATLDALERSAQAQRHLAFNLDAGPTVVTGQPDRISRAVSNVIDNACKWSPPGGSVDVKLADGVLSVRDHGPGFDAEDLPKVFDRFYRAGKDRTMPG